MEHAGPVKRNSSKFWTNFVKYAIIKRARIYIDQIFFFKFELIHEIVVR
jgi:hypothetical protein